MFYLVETNILIDNLIAYLVNSLHMVLKKVSFTFNMNEFLSVYIANHSPNYEIFCQIECKWIKTVNVCKRLSFYASIWLLYLYVHHGYTLNKFMKKNDITISLSD